MSLINSEKLNYISYQFNEQLKIHLIIYLQLWFIRGKQYLLINRQNKHLKQL